MKKEDLKVGQILYKEDLTELTISKIANKYFECEGNWRDKFSIETLRKHCPEYTQAEYQLYTDKQQILDMKEKNKLEHKLRESIGQWGSTKLTLQALRDIIKIIELDRLKKEL